MFLLTFQEEKVWFEPVKYDKLGQPDLPRRGRMFLLLVTSVSILEIGATWGKAPFLVPQIRVRQRLSITSVFLPFSPLLSDLSNLKQCGDFCEPAL